MTYAASRKKNHLISSCTLSHVFTKASNTSGSDVARPPAEEVAEGQRIPEIILLKCETWNWGWDDDLEELGVRERKAERCLSRENRI
jgi:hypothetical protein